MHRRKRLCHFILWSIDEIFHTFNRRARPFFITWRLFGSLPAEVNQKVLISDRMPGDPTPGRVFLAKDRLLERALGPKWLSNPEIASFVAEQIRRGDVGRRFYALHAWAIMPNHVHMLMTPDISVAKIMRWLKGSTARYANRVLGLTGSVFWQDESWDRWIRSDEEFRRIRRYIEFNPVSAGLVQRPEEWAWSSAARGGAQAKAPVPRFT